MKSLSIIFLLCCGLFGCIGTIDTTPKAILAQSRIIADVAPPDDSSTSSPMTFNSETGVITEDMADLIDDMYVSAGTDMYVSAGTDMYVSAGTQNEDMLHTTCTEEMCDQLDNDCDGNIDEGVLNACGACGDVPEESCDELDNDCDGNIDEGVLNVCGACGDVPEESCDELDNDCDGNIDEGVLNACGACGDVPEESCDELDNDCDGNIDENVCALLNLDLDLDGDCLTVECPPEAPYPIGCQIDFMGSDSRGCVAYNPPSSSVYLQEGNHCGAGGITGILTCSTVSRGQLNATNCPINKQDVSYPTDPLDCAETN